MSFLAVVGAFVTIFATGCALLRFIEPKLLPEGFLARIALSWLLGTGTISLLIWFFGFVVSGTWLAGVVTATCLALVLSAWKSSRLIPREIFRPGAKLGKIELFLGTLIVAEIVLIIYLCSIHTLGGDGILNWEIKARYAYLNGGALPTAYLHDASRSFSHLDYPLAIPYTQLWLYFWLGEPSQFWAKTIFPIFYIAAVALVIALGSKLSANRPAALITAIVLFFIPQVSVGGGSATVGYADFPLSVFYLATIGYLLCACQSRNDSSFGIYACCLALLPWVKREGTILWLVAAVCGVLVIWRTKRPLRHLLALVPGALVIIGWQFYLWKTHAVKSTDFSPVNFANLHDNVHRFAPILSAFLAEIMNLKVWSFFWLMIGIAGVYFVRRFRDVRSVVFLVALIAPVCFYISLYIFSAWPDYQQHIGLSVSRLLMQLAPVACLALPVALEKTCFCGSPIRLERFEATNPPVALIHTSACQS